ncbi:Neuroendocrine convertase 1 like protein [Argiope bruennichi]|uniref:Neuroendocrine convertase 1 like protein n=1 Tax=Argiope bruennichi TaxID=94029 RepID=A0A8T0EP42_ARGBR|nr:Neuroendocrine convertase 1 like protein [Argiope bruennichi]
MGLKNVPFILLLATIHAWISRNPYLISAEERVLGTNSTERGWQKLFEKLKRISLFVEKEAVDSGVFSNLLVLQATGDIEDIKSVAETKGLIFIRKVFKDGNYYLFRHLASCKRCLPNSEGLLKDIEEHSSVRWVALQTPLERVKRSINGQVHLSDIYRATSALREPKSYFREKELQNHRNTSLVHFDDPLFNEQWYLLNKGQTGSPPENDINVLPVWKSGITGRGVRISVLDDGIHPQSEELAQNYDSIVSDDLSFRSNHANPIPENSHGTYCAAIAAGVANNKVCGVGVAFDAKIGGVRVIDGPVTDAQEAMALVHALDYVDIYTASWGPNDDGRSIAGPGTLAKLAFLKGISEGRNGKGAIYVWAAGNGGRLQDNCNLDGYASSPYTVTIGAVTADGHSTYYSEPCAAVIASAYVGGSHVPPTEDNIMSERRKIKVVVPEGRGKCRETFQGTSAAAPMAAGVIALLLQANPNLSWRDVQHIIVRSSRVPPTGESGWTMNGAGHFFHLKIGFGILDSAKMVAEALTWQSVKPLHEWKSQPITRANYILPHRDTIVPLLVEKSTIQVDRLESVTATVSIIHPRCGDLELFLQSPSGTVSQILTRRPRDNRTSRILLWEFVSLHFWDEDPAGLWTLKISNRAGWQQGVMDYFSLILRGTIR